MNAKIHKNTLETWWCNILRTWLGARRLLSRKFVFEAAGLPIIRDFSTYLLAKRSFFQKEKNLEFYPVPSIPTFLEKISHTRTRTQTSRRVRITTISKTDETDRTVWQKENGSAATWLMSTLRSNQTLLNLFKNNAEWQDFPVRKALNAFSIKLKFLWSKIERMEVFERETPAYQQNVQI